MCASKVPILQIISLVHLKLSNIFFTFAKEKSESVN